MVRCLSFFFTVIDSDESTYLVIAKALAEGYTYQVDYVDTKPIGIFLIFAGLNPLLGGSIVGYRLVGALALALTAFFLYQAKRADGSHHQSGLAAGIIYLLLNSVYTMYGVSPNTETYFNLFTALALWLFLRHSKLWAYFLAGLILGIGFVIKYVVVFDGLAFGVFLVWQALAREGNVVKALGRALLMAIGAVVPFALVVAWYHQQGQFDPFWFHSITVAGRYPSGREIGHYFEFFFQFFLRFLPITLLYWAALRHSALKPSTRWLGLIWSAFTLVSVLLPGNSFGHYYIQFMLPFSFLAGEFFGSPPEQLPKWLQWVRRPKPGYVLLALLLLGHLLLQKKDYIDRRDHVREALAYLEPRLAPEDEMYAERDQIIYYLTDRLPLIKYVHPSLFWQEKHIQAMEIDIAEEVRKIETAAPRFLLFRLPIDDERFATFREQYYRPVKDIGDQIRIFERRAEAPVQSDF